MRLVFDTNVLVSALFFPLSKPRNAFDVAINEHLLLISDETYEELENIVLKPKFDKYVNSDIRKQFLKEFKKLSLKIKITEKISVCRDIKDNKFLEVAISGIAGYLITGDNDLLVLNPFREIKIINPAEFVELMKKSS